MIENITPAHVLVKAIPELRNPRYRQIYEAGRAQCFIVALGGNNYQSVPLYSHNPTWQSLFKKGWLSVSASDVRLAKAKQERHYAPVN